jgi:hypothetical protein
MPVMPFHGTRSPRLPGLEARKVLLVRGQRIRRTLSHPFISEQESMDEYQ